MSADKKPRASGAPAENGEARVAAGSGNASAQDDSATIPQEPEHRNDRRRFLIFACMLGAVPPQRVVERVIADIEREGQ